MEWLYDGGFCWIVCLLKFWVRAAMLNQRALLIGQGVSDGLSLGSAHSVSLTHTYTENLLFLNNSLCNFQGVHGASLLCRPCRLQMQISGFAFIN